MRTLFRFVHANVCLLTMLPRPTEWRRNSFQCAALQICLVQLVFLRFCLKVWLSKFQNWRDHHKKSSLPVFKRQSQKNECSHLSVLSFFVAAFQLLCLFPSAISEQQQCQLWVLMAAVTAQLALWRCPLRVPGRVICSRSWLAADNGWSSLQSQKLIESLQELQWEAGG